MINNSCKFGNDGKRPRKEQDTTTTTTIPDRLSHLPEPIIYHILSFLDTKSAVRTSVLSRAWRSAWKHVPVLDLRSDDFEEYENFPRFLNHVLSCRYNLNVWKVRYRDDNDTVNGEENELYVGMCAEVVKYALSHATQHLMIDLASSREFEESCEFSELFGSNLNCNLRALGLNLVALDSGFRSSGFQMLTTLCLETCMLDYDPEEDLVPFSSFPCLKNLTLDHCIRNLYIYRGEEFSVKIYGPQLLSLKLSEVFFRKIEIVAPKLKFFSLCYFHGISEFSVLHLPSLDHADVLFEFRGYPSMDNNEWDTQHVIPLYQGLSNAVSLRLDSFGIQVLSKNLELLEQQPPSFTRLESLAVEADSIPYEVVDFFFKGTSSTEPKLEFC